MLAVVLDLVTSVLLVALVELVEVGSDEVVEVRAACAELDVALSEDEVDETLEVLELPVVDVLTLEVELTEVLFTTDEVPLELVVELLAMLDLETLVEVVVALLVVDVADEEVVGS